MEQRLKKVFDLDQIKAFTEAHIDEAEWIEVRRGVKQRALVIDTLADSHHGAYIPGMILELFGEADGYDLENPYNRELNETIHDALEHLEDRINDALNELMPPRGVYYIGFHQYDSSYCLFYEEWEEEEEEEEYKEERER